MKKVCLLHFNKKKPKLFSTVKHLLKRYLHMQLTHYKLPGYNIDHNLVKPCYIVHNLVTSRLYKQFMINSLEGVAENGRSLCFSDVKCLCHSVLGIQRRRLDNSSTVTYTEDNDTYFT